MDSLAAYEIRCGHYDESLQWEIHSTKSDSGTYTLRLLLSSNEPRGYGYFYIDSVLFTAIGDTIGSLFTMTGEKKIFTKRSHFPYAEDPPVWVYDYYDNGRLVLKEGPTAPCYKLR